MTPTEVGRAYGARLTSDDGVTYRGDCLWSDPGRPRSIVAHYPTPRTLVVYLYDGARLVGTDRYTVPARDAHGRIGETAGHGCQGCGVTR